jgi:teichuronic acid biosynthesis glycosyltransferase TuaC
MNNAKVLFVSSGKGNQPGPIIQSQAISLQKQGITIFQFTINQKGLKGYIKECFRLRGFLKKNKFELVHAHYGLTAIITLLARRKEKLVVSFMGDDIVGSRKPDGRISKKSIFLASFNAFLAYWFYDFSIVKSEQMLNKLKANNVALIPNGVDTSRFLPKSKAEERNKLKIDPQVKLAIFVSNPSRVEKNFLLAEKAVKILNNTNVSLLPLFGIDHQSLIDYYNAAELLVLTSYHEGSPNVIKEAMACNCPIVSTNVGDVKWVLGKTEGCYIASFNPQDFAEKVKTALDFSEKYGRTKGRERIIELGLDSKTVAKKIIGLYERVLNSGSKK